jgi:hypothetical protein
MTDDDYRAVDAAVHALFDQNVRALRKGAAPTRY